MLLSRRVETISALRPRRQAVLAGARLNLRIERARCRQIRIASVRLPTADLCQPKAIARPRGTWLLRDGLFIGLDRLGVMPKTQLDQPETIEVSPVGAVALDRFAAILQRIIKQLIAQTTRPAALVERRAQHGVVAMQMNPLVKQWQRCRRVVESDVKSGHRARLRGARRRHGACGCSIRRGTDAIFVRKAQ